MQPSDVIDAVRSLISNRWFWMLTALWVLTLSIVHALNAFVHSRPIGLVLSALLNLLTVAASFLAFFILPLWILGMFPIPMPEQREAFVASATLGIGLSLLLRRALRRTLRVE